MACGIDSGYEDYKYIYFVVPYGEYYNRTVCVKDCPNENSTVLDCKPNSNVTSCNKKNCDYSLSTI